MQKTGSGFQNSDLLDPDPYLVKNEPVSTLKP